MNKAFFLDRDGVINVEVGYLHRPEDVVLLPGAAEAIRKINAAGCLAVVVSNQSGAARGMFTMDAVEAVEKRIAGLLAPACIDAFYYCPHHRDGKVPELSFECDCRKPKPGLLRKAVREWNIDPARSYMIGDQLSDLRAGDAAGCAQSVLVATGHGADNLAEARTENRMVFPGILDAVNYLLKI